MAAPDRDPSEACVIGLNKDWAAECPAKMCAPNRPSRPPGGGNLHWRARTIKALVAAQYD